MDITQALTREDIDELEQIIARLEVDFAQEFANGQIAESPEKLRRILVRYFRTLIGEGDFVAPRCNAPHFSTVIEVDGTLRPCYFLPSYGSLREGQNLDKIINNDAAQTLRAAYANGERKECERCVCPLYKGPRSLLRM